VRWPFSFSGAEIDMLAVRIDTAEGVFTAWFTNEGLARLDFPETRPQPSNESAQKSFSPELRRWLQLTEAALGRALHGKAPASLPPLDMSGGTEFQRRVWAALRQIPFGKTSTYAQVATTIGRSQSVRAVGNACGANPIPVLVPCHRVVAKRGLGGFSSGLDWKRRLLSREGAVVDREPWIELFPSS
jgi:O-6-methylguanine DNA methyltransferase